MSASKPYYFSFLNQESECTFFTEIWAEQLKAFSNTSWIDALEIEDGEKYSRDFHSDDFPLFANWPHDFSRAFESATSDAQASITQHLKDAECHRIDGDTIYILNEEVWLSTKSYGNGDIRKMNDATDTYDSVVTAAYVYINEHKEWSEKHGVKYEALNILSSLEEQRSIDSLIGTMQECDGCATYAVVTSEEGSHVYCCEDCEII